jgi:hypothetical protein
MQVRPAHSTAALGLAAVLALLGSAGAIAQPAAAPHASSPYLAGYTSQVQGSGTIASITVPAFDCPPNTDARVAFGIADQGPNDPQPVVRAAVDAVCNAEGGSIEYGAEVAVPGQTAVSGAVSPGDVLSFSITYGKYHKVVASVIDQTDPGDSISLTGTSAKAALHFGALPIVEGDDTLLAVPDFGRIEVDHAAVNGVSLTGSSTVRYNRVDDGQTSIVATRFARTPSKSGSFSMVVKT